MARKLRIQYPGAIYHVMNRGDRREAIFEDDKDRGHFLSTLSEACEKTGWQVQAYCLMCNHLHLLVETPREQRSKTTLPLAWIAQRLCMGTRGHLAWLLQQKPADPQAPSGQPLLRF